MGRSQADVAATAEVAVLGCGAAAIGAPTANDQGSTTSYRLVLLRNGHVSATLNLTLGDGRTWQRTVPFTGQYTLAAYPYRLPDLTHPYRYVATNSTKVAGS